MKDPETILLIDDEASQRKFMRRILREAGYHVLEGADYNEARAMHHHYRGIVDLLVTDVSLPGRNGYELARTLVDADPGLKVIFISGPAGAEMCSFYGMSPTDAHFLEKPFAATDFLERVRRVLNGGEAHSHGRAGA